MPFQSVPERMGNSLYTSRTTHTKVLPLKPTRNFAFPSQTETFRATNLRSGSPQHSGRIPLLGLARAIDTPPAKKAVRTWELSQKLEDLQPESKSLKNGRA